MTTAGLYGLAVHDGALVGYWVVLAGAAAIILARLSWTARVPEAA